MLIQLINPWLGAQFINVMQLGAKKRREVEASSVFNFAEIGIHKLSVSAEPLSNSGMV